MSGPASYTSAPMPFNEYDSGAAYPGPTMLPSMSSPTADPIARQPGQLSDRAQALKARLAQSGAGPEAGTTSAGPAPFGVHPSMARPLSSIQPPQQYKPHQPLQRQTDPMLRVSDVATPSVSIPAYGPPAPYPSSHALPSTLPVTGETATAYAAVQGGSVAQLDRLIALLEQRASYGPDTTTEDLVSLAFVGIFFMLAVHAMTPVAPYRR
jgi:hypothetical protein